MNSEQKVSMEYIETDIVIDAYYMNLKEQVLLESNEMAKLLTLKRTRQDCDINTHISYKQYISSKDDVSLGYINTNIFINIPYTYQKEDVGPEYIENMILFLIFI